jgi:hypothetical protein
LPKGGIGNKMAIQSFSCHFAVQTPFKISIAQLIGF